MVSLQELIVVLRAISFMTLAAHLGVAMASKAEDRLLANLFTDYNMLSRPVVNHSDTINVHLGIAISQIIEVDQKKEKIILSMWLKLGWYDYRLTWNESEYEGVNSIRVPRSKIWTPDIVLYNRVEQDSNEGEDKFLIPVYSDGSCQDCPLSVVTARCSIDIKWFPFDDQLCTLVYESWTFDASILNISLYHDGNERKSLEPNCEWDITEIRSYRTEKYFEPGSPPFISAVFEIHLSRKVLYYAVNLILPCALISFLTPLCFLIPVEAGDRIGLGITILLAMSVYQIIILEKIPTSSEGIPLIGSYFIVLICMNAVAIILMIAIVNLHQPMTNPMPRWAHSFIFKYLCRLMRMSKPTTSSSSNQRTDKQDSDPVISDSLELCSDCALMRFKNGSVDVVSNVRSPSCPISKGEVLAVDQDGLPPCSRVLLGEHRESRGDEKSEAEMSDWKFTALVLERLCVLFFGAFQIICSLTLALFIFEKLLTTHT